MRKTEIKNCIRSLRKEGLTFQEINKAIKMNVSKSTLSNWCEGIKMPKFYYQKVARLNRQNMAIGREIASSTRKKESVDFIQNLRKVNTSLLRKFERDKDVKKIALAILYLGEGSKWKGHRGLMLGSSDPNIVCLYINLLKEVYNISKQSLHAGISYRVDQNLNKLITFWSKTTGLNKNQFYKTKPDARTIGKPTKNKNYKGVCVISCAGTKIQLELEEISKMLSMGR